MTDDVEVVTQNLPAVRASEAMVARGEVSVSEVVAQRDKIEQVMNAVMKKGVHYGEVPGVSKPTLLKPGAEVLAVTFRFAPSYHSDRVFHDDGHLTVVSRCVLTHIPTSLVVAEGEGLCTSHESKYAQRNARLTCPLCGAPEIRKSKHEPEWYCWKKQGGCGEKFPLDDVRITEQSQGKVANPDLADTWNTVLKMANKRAMVAAILNGTAASDIFTQDVEDLGAAASDEPGPGSSDMRPAWNAPKSWKEIAARLTARLGEHAMPVWMEEALLSAYGVARIAELDETMQPDAAARLAEVIRVLDEADADPFDLGVSPRPLIQAAFAAGFDGIVLDGPEWRLGPDEHDRQSREQIEDALDLEAAEQNEMAETDIPFGESEEKE